MNHSIKLLLLKKKLQIERESEREPKPNRLCCFGSEEEEGFLLARERDRDVRPRQANRAAEEV